MDEVLELLSRFMLQIDRSLPELDDEEAGQIAQFLQEAFSLIQEIQATPRQVEPQIPQGVDLLWILSGSEPNAFVNYLRTYPGPGFKELASNPTLLTSVIERLQRENPQQQITQDAQGIESTLYPSSNVSGMKYDPKNQKLYVKFHGENQEPIYQYDGVPPQIFYLLQHGNAFARTKGRNRWGEWWPMKNPSIGAAVNQYLKKGGFAYSRIA